MLQNVGSSCHPFGEIYLIQKKCKKDHENAVVIRDNTEMIKNKKDIKKPADKKTLRGIII